jgi:hypothetical protein
MLSRRNSYAHLYVPNLHQFQEEGVSPKGEEAFFSSKDLGIHKFCFSSKWILVCLLGHEKQANPCHIIFQSWIV